MLFVDLCDVMCRNRRAVSSKLGGVLKLAIGAPGHVVGSQILGFNTSQVSIFASGAFEVQKVANHRQYYQLRCFGKFLLQPYTLQLLPYTRNHISSQEGWAGTYGGQFKNSRKYVDYLKHNIILQNILGIGFPLGWRKSRKYTGCSRYYSICFSSIVLTFTEIRYGIKLGNQFLGVDTHFQKYKGSANYNGVCSNSIAVTLTEIFKRVVFRVWPDWSGSVAK